MIDGQGVTELFMTSVKSENLIFVVLGMVAPRLPTVRKKNTQNNKTIIIYDRHYENSAASNKLYVAKNWQMLSDSRCAENILKKQRYACIS